MGQSSAELCIDVCENANDNTQWANQCLDKLDALCGRADALAGTVDDPRASAELRRAKFAVERRVLIWGPAILIPQKTLTPEVFVDVHTVLAGIERYENSGLTADASRIVEFEGGLNVSIDKNAQQLSQTLEQVYRNANVCALHQQRFVGATQLRKASTAPFASRRLWPCNELN